ncbi:MAG: hypothetical protein ACRDHK_06490 [Actinomycetota bacterium]
MANVKKFYTAWANRELSEAKVLAMHDLIATVVRQVRVFPRQARGLDERVAIEYRR